MKRSSVYFRIKLLFQLLRNAVESRRITQALLIGELCRECSLSTDVDTDVSWWSDFREIRGTRLAYNRAKDLLDWCIEFRTVVS